MAEAKRVPVSYKAIKWLIWKLSPKMRVDGLENLPEGGAVIVGNHAHMYGPIAAELYIKDNHHIWCAAQMMELKEVPAYAYQDFWSMKPWYTHWYYRLFSYLVAPLCVLVFNNANTIPVYHDARVMITFRQTLRLLRKGEKIVIFPEHTVPHNNIVYDFQDRFIDLAQMYYRITQKEMCFVPMYTAPKLKKMVLGQPIRYRAGEPPEQERLRIKEELMDAVTRLGRSLPPHTVVPYAVIPRKDYPSSQGDEQKGR
ncbi:MAG: 1-acyl-sn-glycerol-3-phosphate acyltransferase [Clostridia bacterium]|nr:1-acyl-sn-glycerol-3-phosphate acyltransferase [Clostridia bacterium]